VNAAEGEFGGVFVSKQPGDTDRGGKAPQNILAKGIFYGRIEE
jgi:photosystem II oxygen-evolving enhancer protein 1